MHDLPYHGELLNNWMEMAVLHADFLYYVLGKTQGEGEYMHMWRKWGHVDIVGQKKQQWQDDTLPTESLCSSWNESFTGK